MGGNGEIKTKSRYELLWERMSVASRGALDAVDKNVRNFSGVYLLRCASCTGF